jgi:hypothetical protein
MEDLDVKVAAFLHIPIDSGDGSGYGSGDGYGYGDGSGDGSGYGSGYGYGYGYGSGSGYGSGYGSGPGSGSGDGDGSGSGSGYGSGYGSGDGDGDGDGDGVSNINGFPVHQIDGIPTIISSVHGSIALGFILNSDLTLTKTYVAKSGGHFAHGASASDARRDAIAKALQSIPAEERVALFLSTAKELYTGHELLNIHRQLTGSCEQGCRAFVKSKQIEMDRTYTLIEFVDIVSGQYGSKVIDELRRQLNRTFPEAGR